MIDAVAKDTSETDCEGMKPPTYTGKTFDALSPDAVELLLLWDGLWADVCE